jgi:hypothetical protein
MEVELSTFLTSVWVVSSDPLIYTILYYIAEYDSSLNKPCPQDNVFNIAVNRVPVCDYGKENDFSAK